MYFFTARYTIVQSAVLRLLVVHLSVRPSVCFNVPSVAATSITDMMFIIIFVAFVIVITEVTLDESGTGLAMNHSIDTDQQKN